jgi:hypothetical protein
VSDVTVFYPDRSKAEGNSKKIETGQLAHLQTRSSQPACAEGSQVLLRGGRFVA